jgi:flagellar basal body-associated protein FliL
MKFQSRISTWIDSTFVQPWKRDHILGMDNHSFMLCLIASAILIAAFIGALGHKVIRDRSFKRSATAHRIISRASDKTPPHDDIADGPVVHADIGPVLVNLSSKNEYIQAKVSVEIDIGTLERQLANEQEHILQREEAPGSPFTAIWSNSYVRRGVEPKEMSRLIAARKNRMQDLFISSLSSRNLENIRDEGSLNRLKTELVGLFNEAFEVEKPVINEVYFQHFQVF